MINEKGEVMRCDSGRVLKQSIIKAGYPVVSLWMGNKGKTKYVHRLLAEAFIPNPECKREVNHIDGVKTNNSLDNLEWVTPSENMKHAYENKLNYHTEKGRLSISKSISERNKKKPPRSKEVVQLDCEGNLLKEFKSATEAAEFVGISFSMVCAICRGTKSSKKWFFKYKEEI